MSLQIGKAIYNILSSDKDLVKKVDNKIYPLVTAVDTSFPFIVYKRIGIEPTNSKDRLVMTENVYVEILVASDKYNESIELADSVKQALQGKRGNYLGIYIQEIILDDADEDYIDDTFIQGLKFKIKTKYGSTKC